MSAPANDLWMGADAFAAVTAADQAIAAAGKLLDAADFGNPAAAAAAASQAIEPLLDAARLAIELAAALPGDLAARRIGRAAVDHAALLDAARAQARPPTHVHHLQDCAGDD